MTRRQQIITLIALIVFGVFMVGYAMWKTDGEWLAAEKCACGNIDALFAGRDKFYQAHITGNMLAVIPIVAGVFFLVIYRRIGYIVSILTGIYLFFSFFGQRNAQYAYDQFLRDTRFLELLLVVIPLVIAARYSLRSRQPRES